MALPTPAMEFMRAWRDACNGRDVMGMIGDGVWPSFRGTPPDTILLDDPAEPITDADRVTVSRWFIPHDAE